MSPIPFGTTPSGEEVRALTIRGGGLTARLMTWGAGIVDLRLEGHALPLVLGFDDFTHYPAHSPYFGVSAGRYANRIRDGKFTIDGVVHQTDRNFLGKHLLHGGAAGLGKRNWRLVEAGSDQADFSIRAADGEMGFPGNLDVTCIYRLGGDGVLSVTFEAATDAPTLCNMAHHSYFNLADGGAGDCLDHEMRIEAAHYLPVDDELIPTGDIAPVAGTPFDFTRSRPIRHEAGGAQTVYDHNFCLSRKRGPLREVAQVRSPTSGVTMAVATTEAGLQFYAGHKVQPPVPGLDGINYGPFSGFCLEAQAWPDSPNHPDWPGALLRPGETCRSETQYRFALAQ
ncbi:MAG TPA: aldose epimerase family protein [Rhizobiaceae bacterium]|nr:aldose epimerase family protein [Rhizobiaceae bacterium]